MQRDGHPEDAIRQIRYWFTYYIDSFVTASRAAPRVPALSGARGAGPTADDHDLPLLDRHPRTITPEVIAEAHHGAWRHAIVRAQRSANRADWTLLTDADTAEAYFDLVKWTSAKYHLGLDSVLSALTDMGHRHDSR
jgi:hypothetical protein